MKQIIIALLLLSSLVGMAQKRTTAPKKAVDTTNFFGMPVTFKTVSLAKGQTFTFPAKSYLQRVQSTAKDNRVEASFISGAPLVIYLNAGKSYDLIETNVFSMGKAERQRNWYAVRPMNATIKVSGPATITYFTLYP